MYVKDAHEHRGTNSFLLTDSICKCYSKKGLLRLAQKTPVARVTKQEQGQATVPSGEKGLWAKHVPSLLDQHVRDHKGCFLKEAAGRGREPWGLKSLVELQTPQLARI